MCLKCKCLLCLCYSSIFHALHVWLWAYERLFALSQSGNQFWKTLTHPSFIIMLCSLNSKVQHCTNTGPMLVSVKGIFSEKKIILWISCSPSYMQRPLDLISNEWRVKPHNSSLRHLKFNSEEQSVSKLLSGTVYFINLG